MTRFELACKQCKKKWEESGELPISSFPKVDSAQQKKNETCINQLFQELQEVYEHQNFEELDKRMDTWFHSDEVWKLSWLNDEEKSQFYRNSKQFMKEARDFDATLSLDNISQAMRNVWIYMILTKIFQRKIRYHKAIFAYSMLYPYTDNFLDDTTISAKEKKQFNDWLSERLIGKTTTYQQQNQEKVNSLVTMIEEVYPREEYPIIYEALCLIQNGQKKSLLQSETADYETLLEISIEKGGSSVLADGFLINGELDEEEYAFCIEFGFMLQIADDIQDLQEDREHGHHTLASIIESKQSNVALCNSYFQFVRNIIHVSCPNKEHELRIFIEDNCRLLIFFSLMKNAKHYTHWFLYKVRKRLPFRYHYLDELMGKMEHFKRNDNEMLTHFDMYLKTESQQC